MKNLTDEELVRRQHDGDQTAGSILLQRYFEARVPLLHKLCPDQAHCLEKWDLNTIFYEAFIAAVEKYNYQYRFSTFFCACYRNRARHAFRDLQRTRPSSIGGTVSLDAEMGEEGNEYTLSEFVPDPSSTRGVIPNVEAGSLLHEIASLPADKFDPLTLTVALLLRDGYRVSEIARMLYIERPRVKRIIAALRDHLNDQGKAPKNMD